MKNTFTTITTKESGISFSFRERISREEAISKYKKHLKDEIEHLTKILNTADEDFNVIQHNGLYVRKNVKKLN